MNDDLIYMVDDNPYGMIRALPEDVLGMFMPVQCRQCGQVYDAGHVTVTGRFQDCTVWKAPCCGVECDDRAEGWGFRRNYTEIDKRQLRQR